MEDRVMNHSVDDLQGSDLMRKALEVAIRLFLVAALTYWCFLIFKPFLMPLLWGIIIAVALNPWFDRLVSLLGGRRKLAVALFILVGLGALIVPAYLLSGSFFDGVKWLTAQVQKDAVTVPPPPAKVAEWPVIGPWAHETWTQASENIEATLARFAPQLQSFISWLLSTLAGLGFAFLMTVLSIIIAALMLMRAEGGGKTALSIGARLGGEKGEAAVDLAVRTIRSVATGVVGVAAVQALLSAVGLFLAGIPAAGLWAVLVLILAVAQLPPLLILGPAIVYLFATSDSTMTNALFTVWALLISASDSFLKPMFLGRGLDIPMPVILIGAIGGMLLSGIIGLFVGAVVLALGYKLFTAWLKEQDDPGQPTSLFPQQPH
jgi:predicted PurR-regulated permease PerM